MCLTDQAFLKMVADTGNLETLKGLPKFDGKGSEQCRQEISVNAETWDS